jgi:hypothetical protein
MSSRATRRPQCGAHRLTPAPHRPEPRTPARGSPICVTSFRAHADRGTCGLDRTRWRRSRRRSCKKPGSRAPLTHAPAVPACHLCEKPDQQAASPDTDNMQHSACITQKDNMQKRGNATCTKRQLPRAACNSKMKRKACKTNNLHRTACNMQKRRQASDMQQIACDSKVKHATDSMHHAPTLASNMQHATACNSMQPTKEATFNRKHALC